MPSFDSELILPCSQEGIFDFLRRPANIARISQPDMGLKFTLAPEVIEAGSRLEFQIVSFNQVHKVVHVIETLTPHSLIHEKLIQGPMPSWIHQHRFEPHADGVRLVDVIEFKLPGGLLGMFLSEDKILDQLEDGFFHRGQQLRRLVDAGEIQ